MYRHKLSLFRELNLAAMLTLALQLLLNLSNAYGNFSAKNKLSYINENEHMGYTK